MTILHEVMVLRRCLISQNTLRGGRRLIYGRTFSVYSMQKHNINRNTILYNRKNILSSHKQLLHTSNYSLAEDEKVVKEKNTDTSEPTTSGKLKRSGEIAKVFAEFGTTAVLFHTCISLTSLGICYTAVSSGVDVVALLLKLNLISEVTTEAKLAGGAGTFVIAYACHKVFMPVRIFITVTCTPLIVKKLRQIGLLKTPVPK